MTAVKRIPTWFFAVVDQGVVAAANLGLSVVMARAGGLNALGVYSLVSLTTLSCLGLVRTLITDPWLASPTVHEQFAPPMRSLLALSSVATGLAVLVVVLVVVPGQTFWLVACLVAVAFVVQDSGRYAAYKSDQPQVALASDGLVLLGLLAVVGIGFLFGGGFTVGGVLLGWLAGLLLGVIPAHRTILGSLAHRGIVTWWQEVCRRLALPLFSDSVAFFLAVTVSLYTLAAVASAEAVGGVRVVQSLYSPLAVVFTGFNMWLVPTLARHGLAASIRPQRLATLGLSLIAAGLTVVAVVVGPALAGVIFGSGTAPTRIALFVAGVWTWLMAISTPWIASIKVFGRYAPIPLVRTIGGLLTLVALVLVPSSRSVEGYCILLTFQYCGIAAVAWVLQSRVHLARRTDRSRAAQVGERRSGS